MDNRRTLILMLLLLPILLFWNQITTVVFKQLGYDPIPTIVQSTTAPSTQPSMEPGAVASTPSTTPLASGTAPSMTASAGLRAAPSTRPEITTRIGSSDPD